MGLSKADSCSRKNTISRIFKELSRCRSPLRNLISGLSGRRFCRNNRGLGGRGAYRVAPEGCFTVYVGPEKQRFVVSTEHANHPMFGLLLDEAAREYGFQRDGPIMLPCDVELFCKVLAEIDCCGGGSDDSDETGGGSGGWMRMWGRAKGQLDGQYNRLLLPRSLEQSQFL